MSLRERWNITHDEVSMGKELGRGMFGVVFKGLWRDIPVAVKTLNENSIAFGDPTFAADMEKEIAFLQHVRHQNIVLFFGFGTSATGVIFIVIELVELGTLSNYLKTHLDMDWEMKNRFALDIAQVLRPLHAISCLCTSLFLFGISC